MFETWLENVQGRLVSLELLQEIKSKIQQCNIVNNREILKFIVKEFPDVDANYVFAHVIGAHIRRLTSEETTVILEEYSTLQNITGIDKVPNMFVLEYICKKRDIPLAVPIRYSEDRVAYYNNILSLPNVS